MENEGKAKKKPIWKDNVEIDDMIPMKGAQRPYYDPNTYLKLKRSLSRGFKSEGAVSALWDEELGKYEIYKGTHRLQGSKDVGHKTIPMWDYTGVIDKTQAIAEGYTDNDLNAPMNPMARFYAFNELSKRLLKEHKKTGAGRNPTMVLKAVAEMIHTSEATVSHHLKFGEFTKPIQDLIGRGRLRVKQAVTLSQLIGKVSDRELEKLCKTASRKFWSPQRTLFEVGKLLKKGNDCSEMCPCCKRLTELELSPVRGMIIRYCSDCSSSVRKALDSVYRERQSHTERLKAFLHRHGRD